MVNYARVAMSCVLLLIIGVVLLTISNSIVIPGQYQTFLGIPYASNPEYALALMEKLFLIILGIVFLAGAGLVALAGVASGQMKTSHSPFLKTSQKRYCVHCGAENSVEVSFCQKCGEKLVKS